MRNVYWVMAKQFADIILATSPNAAQYDEDPVSGEMQLILTAIEPVGFTGTTIDLSLQGFIETPNPDDPDEVGLSPTELTATVDNMRAAEATGALVILSKPQGKWLRKNHPAFMPKVSEDTYL